MPAGAILAESKERDRLKLAKAAGVEINGKAINDASQMVEALAVMPRPTLFGPRNHDNVGVRVEEVSPEELAAAAAEAAAGSPSWLERLNMERLARLVKLAPRVARGA